VIKVFVSSVQRDFDEVRGAVRAAIESVEMAPMMAETEAANPDSPRRALLDRVAEADALLLLLGWRYGERGRSGYSPTEDEYREAERLRKPILVLRQDVDLDPDQRAFLERTRGGWEAGKLTGSFRDERDVGFEVIKALRALERRLQGRPDAAAAAQERARQLGAGGYRANTTSSGSTARLVAVPAGGRRLLNAVALDKPSIGDDVGNDLRSTGLVTHEVALDIVVRGDGIHLTAKTPREYERLSYFVGADGAIVAEGMVRGESQFFGGMQIAAARLADVVERSLRFAAATWDRIDAHDDVREAALVVSVPDAASKVFTTQDPGNSMRMPMGGAGGLPAILVAPDPPEVARREDCTDPRTASGLVAEVKRRFADAGAINA